MITFSVLDLMTNVPQYKTLGDGTRLLLVTTDEKLVYKFQPYGSPTSGQGFSQWVCRECQKLDFTGGILRVNNDRFVNNPVYIEHKCKPSKSMSAESDETEADTENIVSVVAEENPEKGEDPEKCNNPQTSPGTGFLTVVVSDSDADLISPGKSPKRILKKESPGDEASVNSGLSPGKTKRRRAKHKHPIHKNAIKFQPMSSVDCDVYGPLLEEWRCQIGPRIREVLSSEAGALRLENSIRNMCKRLGVDTVVAKYFEIMTSDRPVLEIIGQVSRVVAKYLHRISARLAQDPTKWETEEKGPKNSRVAAAVTLSSGLCEEQLNVYEAVLSDWKAKLKPLIRIEGKSVAQRLDRFTSGSEWMSRGRAAKLCTAIIEDKAEVRETIQLEKPVLVDHIVFACAKTKHSFDAEIAVPDGKKGRGTEKLKAARKIGKARAKRRSGARKWLRSQEERNLVRFLRNLADDGYSVPKTFVAGFVSRVLGNPGAVDLNWVEKLVKENGIALETNAEFEAIGRQMFL